MGRFINADGLISTGQGFAGYNMFAYCGNNPVNRVDYSGCLWLAVLAVVTICALVLSGCSSTPATTTPTTVSPAPSTAPATAPTEPQKNYNDFLDDLGMRESSNDYTAVNQYGYLGRYQMGSLALQDAGFQDAAGEWTTTANSHGVYSKTDFLNNPVAQDTAVTAYHKKLCGYIRYYGLDRYVGSTYQGVVVTQSGLLAACHLVGVGSMRDALATGVIVVDGNNVPASQYLSLFGGYDISGVW